MPAFFLAPPCPPRSPTPPAHSSCESASQVPFCCRICSSRSGSGRVLGRLHQRSCCRRRRAGVPVRGHGADGCHLLAGILVVALSSRRSRRRWRFKCPGLSCSVALGSPVHVRRLRLALICALPLRLGMASPKRPRVGEPGTMASAGGYVRGDAGGISGRHEAPADASGAGEPASRG